MAHDPENDKSFSKGKNFNWSQKYKDKYTLFFYKQHFYKQLQAETAKNQANAKQHTEAELLVFENYSHSSFTLSLKNKMTYFIK